MTQIPTPSKADGTTNPMQQELRNIAIIAHVDHGKTTLVDAMLKQSHVFRDNQVVGDLIMDSNELEREKGITILAKNTAITFHNVKINIIDTPGHADFSGEVERVLNMADGCLLVIDAVDGPMPQTRFVLRHALQRHLKPIVFINKIDRPFARPDEVAGFVQDLFLELATDADQLDFPIIYGAAKSGYAVNKIGDESTTMEPLFEAILRHIPPPNTSVDGGFQLLVAALSYDSHLGQIAIGRIARGAVTVGDTVIRIERDGAKSPHKITRVNVFEGLGKRPVESAQAGEIVALAGIKEVAISDTLADQSAPEALPAIAISEPTVQMTFGVNGSPFAAQDGSFLTSRHIRDRLYNELKINVSLRVADTDSADVFLVSGRGELHLAILIETMRREGFEFQVSRPEAIIRVVDGSKFEPFEQLLLDISDEHIGLITESLAGRLAQMTNMQHEGNSRVRLDYTIPTRGLIGFQSAFIKATRGTGVMNSIFTGYQPMKGTIKNSRTGVLVAAEQGEAVTYGINNAQSRGITFVTAGTPVYEGMIVGMQPREGDLVVNICKEKKMTNVRASSSDFTVHLTPPMLMSLEESLHFLADDEVLEVTPKNLRLRKRILGSDARQRASRSKSRVS